jgi:hypothetical protein
LAIKRLVRAGAIAAAMIASSGSLSTARPLFASLGDVALSLTAALSEVEAVRRKITEAPAQRRLSVANEHGSPLPAILFCQPIAP